MMLPEGSTQMLFAALLVDNLVLELDAVVAPRPRLA
jgi:hypothetical protein